MKNFREKIDIILPNYNSQDYIDQNLKSVINQSYKNWKLFIIDDGSNLETRKILKSKYRKNKKIKIIYSQKIMELRIVEFGFKKIKIKIYRLH